jgi:hypothetical protein
MLLPLLVAASLPQLYIGNLTPGAVTDVMLRQVFDSALIAAFPQAAAPGQEPVCKVRIVSKRASRRPSSDG